MLQGDVALPTGQVEVCIPWLGKAWHGMAWRGGAVHVEADTTRYVPSRPIPSEEPTALWPDV